MKKILALMTVLLSPVIMTAGEIPSFPGGEAALNKYLKENIVYPQIARENGVEGIVAVGFIVGTDGSLSNLKVLKYIDPELEKEALRVIGGMPTWEPAEKDGTPIEAPSKVDIPFILEE